MSDLRKFATNLRHPIAATSAALTPTRITTTWHIVRPDGSVACGASSPNLWATIAGDPNVNCRDCIQA